MFAVEDEVIEDEDGVIDGHALVVQTGSPLPPHVQVLQSTFQVSPFLIAFPSGSVQTDWAAVVEGV